MKKLLSSLFVILACTVTASAQTVYGALAIDKSNGFYYGWAYDYATHAGAENRALKECKAKGGNCTVVLTWEGKGCAVYRTIPGTVGTAYGWGVAPTQSAADAIATREALKRSKGVQPTNYVWACNSVGDYKEGKNQDNQKQSDNNKASAGQNMATVKIGNQEWTVKSLDVSTFRNGDPIPLAKNDEEWKAAVNAGLPMSRYLLDKKENGKIYGRMYNWYAVNDPRGLAPEGFHIPTNEEWERLLSRVGGNAVAGEKLKSRTGWQHDGKAELSGTDEFGFNALPGGNATTSGGFAGIGGVANFWSATTSSEKNVWMIPFYGHKHSVNGLSRYPKSAGLYVRCLKD